MVTETKKVFALAALIVATGVATVELTRNPAMADPLLVAGGAAGYAGSRIDVAFQAAADMKPVHAVEVPMADKGDLDVGCDGPFRDDAAAECVDAAMEVESAPSVIVETRYQDGSILMRMDAMTLAGVAGAPLPQAE